MCGGTFCSTSATERKEPCCSVWFGSAKPSPSNKVIPPSKPNQACTTTEPSQADPPLGSVAQCHTQIHANTHSYTLYVCYMYTQPIRSQQCMSRQGQHSGTL